MFELLAGRRPWTAKVAFDVMMQIMNDPPPDLGVVRPGLNPELIGIVNKCLEKEPANRFSSAGEIQEKLDTWRAQKGFVTDDLQSLANFVVRNSTAQIKWYEAALEGEIEQARAPTFKELEEQIDAEREEKDGPKRGGSIRPAAGRRTAPLSPSPPRPTEPTMPPLATPAPTRPLSFDERIAPPPPRGSSTPPGGRPAPGQRLTPSGAPSASSIPDFISDVLPAPPPRREGGASPAIVAPRRAKLASSTVVLIVLVILIVALSVATFLVWRKPIMRTFSLDPHPAATEPAPPSSSQGD
jgi:serine/threonine protein kinase